MSEWKEIEMQMRIKQMRIGGKGIKAVRKRVEKEEENATLTCLEDK